MSNFHQEDGSTRQWAVGQWLKAGTKNARVAVTLAKTPGFETHALYAAQQSMEAAVKAIARGFGKSHQDLYGHNYLQLFLLFLNDVLTVSEAAPEINKMLSKHQSLGETADSIGQVRQMLKLSASPKQKAYQQELAGKFFDDALFAPPETVAMILQLWEELDAIIDGGFSDHRLLSMLASSDFLIRLPGPRENFTASVTKQIISQAVLRLRSLNLDQDQLAVVHKVATKIVATAVAVHGETQFRAEIEANNGRYTLRMDQLEKLPSAPRALMGLLLVGVLVWPHESYPRYPARSDVTKIGYQLTDIVTLKDKQYVGMEQYSDAFGVIKYIQEVSVHAEKITIMLEESYEAGLFLGGPLAQ